METPAAKPTGLKALLTIHKALLIGQLLFAVIAFYLVFTNSIQAGMQHLDKALQVMAIVYSFGGVYAGTVLLRKKILAARASQGNVKAKFEIYRKACIIQWALTEGPSIFAVICFLLTRNYAFLALAAVLVLLFTMLAPSKLKIAFQLQLSEAEISDL